MDQVLVVAVVVVALVGLAVVGVRSLSTSASGRTELVTLRETAARLTADATVAHLRAEELRSQLVDARAQHAQLLDRSRLLDTDRAAAEARLDETRKSVTEQRARWEEETRQLEHTFRSLASEALHTNRTEFLIAAEQQLKSFGERNIADLDSRKASVESLVQPLREAMENLERETANLESQRLREIGKVDQQYRELATSAAGLQRETAKLVNALHSPHVRGRWGQITLRRAAELSGMVDHCDFYEQETAAGRDVRLRPDMIVRLPAERLVVIDAKVPLTGYLEAVEATNEEARTEALSRHARQAREHITQLASKEYQAQFERSPDFVVAFIPNDSVLAAAVESDPDFIEFALNKSVVVATPATLFALLRAIEFGWRQSMATRNAEQVGILGRRLAERMATVMEHFEKIGGSLRRSVESYNDAVGSFESRVLPAARLFRDLSTGASKEIPELAPIDVVPRTVALGRSLPADELFSDEDLDVPVTKSPWAVEPAPQAGGDP